MFNGRHAYNLQNSVETEIHIQAVFNDGDKHVHIDSNPNVGFHCILRSLIERFDFQVLLDPAKKQLDVPTTFVKLGDAKGRNNEAVRMEGQKLLCLSIVIPRASKLVRVIFGRIEAGQNNRLVTS